MYFDGVKYLNETEFNSLYNPYTWQDNCASEEEIESFFEQNNIQIYLLTGANYINFDDMHDPLK